MGAVPDDVRAAAAAGERELVSQQCDAEDLGQGITVRAAGVYGNSVGKWIEATLVAGEGVCSHITLITNLLMSHMSYLPLPLQEIYGMEPGLRLTPHTSHFSLSLQEIYGMEPGRPVDVVDGFSEDVVEGNE